MTNDERVLACAEHVMGWPIWWAGEARPQQIPYVTTDGKTAFIHWANGSSREWNPYTSDDHTFMLVDKLNADPEAKDFTLGRAYVGGEYGWLWHAEFADRGYADDPDRRAAIVLAALKAVGQEGEHAEP